IVDEFIEKANNAEDEITHYVLAKFYLDILKNKETFEKRAPKHKSLLINAKKSALEHIKLMPADSHKTRRFFEELNTYMDPSDSIELLFSSQIEPPYLGRDSIGRGRQDWGNGIEGTYVKVYEQVIGGNVSVIEAIEDYIINFEGTLGPMGDRLAKAVRIIRIKSISSRSTHGSYYDFEEGSGAIYTGNNNIPVGGSDFLSIAKRYFSMGSKGYYVARAYFHEVAWNNNPEAAFYLAQMIEKGIGEKTIPNTHSDHFDTTVHRIGSEYTSIEWYFRSAKLGYEPAIKKLKRLADEDDLEAETYLKKL
ncbi:MAG: hypothetical protein LBV63_02815, partial [Candidatus Methanoplasma sp.]|nr:hypothetical protein [Candidatus Methanoplasma sp.]